MFNNDHDFQISHGAPDTPKPRSSWWSSCPLWIRLLLAYICAFLCGFLLSRYTNLCYPIPGLHWQPTGVQIISYATCVFLYAGYILYYTRKREEQGKVTVRPVVGFMEPLHPMTVIHDYILRTQDDVDVVVTHDDQWQGLFDGMDNKMLP
ncbi:hypothetical protein Moror_10501 [Moniliophthora roreri MCA 2997]|uniref:Uncharacterized protein n=1 Tax=Moniliophthora roreri (strain MCA 2997) TaxID=1381753 RepID=V2YJH6_MONRO|nr:hypothetical protein Moror_10501 [Moniliophthora roreri MCA 2997]